MPVQWTITIWTSWRVSHCNEEGRETFFKSPRKNTLRRRQPVPLSALRFHTSCPELSLGPAFPAPIPPSPLQKACGTTGCSVARGRLGSASPAPPAKTARSGAPGTPAARSKAVAGAAARARALRVPASAPRHSVPRVAREAPQVPHLRGRRGSAAGLGARAGLDARGWARGPRAPRAPPR